MLLQVCAHYAKTKMVPVNLNTVTLRDILLDMVGSGGFYPSGAFLKHNAALDVTKANRALRMVLAPHLITANDIDAVFFGCAATAATVDPMRYTARELSAAASELTQVFQAMQNRAGADGQHILGQQQPQPSPAITAIAERLRNITPGPPSSDPADAVQFQPGEEPPSRPCRGWADSVSERRAAMDVEGLLIEAQAYGLCTLDEQDVQAFHTVLQAMRDSNPGLPPGVGGMYPVSPTHSDT